MHEKPGGVLVLEEALPRSVPYGVLRRRANSGVDFFPHSGFPGLENAAFRCFSIIVVKYNNEVWPEQGAKTVLLGA